MPWQDSRLLRRSTIQLVLAAVFLAALLALSGSTVRVALAQACPGGPAGPNPQPMPFVVFEDVTSPDNHFCPAGFMGDSGDIGLAFGSSIVVTYRFQGQGPNLCGYPPPCRWSGVYFLNPDPLGQPWGIQPGHGFNLSQARRLVFDARSDTGANVEFKVAGVRDVPHGDSCNVAQTVSAGPVQLTPAWTTYQIPLNCDMSYTIGGFVWSASSTYNSGKDAIVFELDNIRFE